jgi:transposase-like protein
MFDLTNPIFSDANLAREHLEALHWPNGPVCPRCGETERVKKLAGKSTRPGVVMCNACRSPFTVTVGTIFEDSKIPLNKWLLGFRLMAGSKKGISAHQLHRSLGITYKSAWFMAHRIREAMDIDDGPLGGSPERVVEADETYVGGSTMNRASKKTAPKKAVVTLVERGGQARSFHVANVHASVLRPILFQNADRLSTLMTDESSVYTGAGQSFWQHQTVVHRLGEYARGQWHTNTAENFFSIFKRGIVGVYHHVSEAHLHRYCREFDFRYNTRSVSDTVRSDSAVIAARGKRLFYRRPSSLAA